MSRNKDKPPLRLEWRKASELAANPANWRLHPQEQLEALDELLAKVGWAGVLLYNERTSRLIDGHARALLKQDSDEPMPVLVGSWTEEQESMILATLDPTAAMAQADQIKLRSLLDSIQADEGSAIEALLERLQKDAKLPEPEENGSDQPGEIPPGISEETVEIQHTCPQCGYRFSGGAVTRERLAQES